MEEEKVLIDKLIKEGSLNLDEYERILESRTELSSYVRTEAVRVRERVYGRKIFIRALIEISNYCRNDCYYCGIRKDNIKINRYRLSADEILTASQKAYELGFRTVVLQGGEDPAMDLSRMCDLIRSIKENIPDLRVTLSLGELSRRSYRALYEAGADRYLLRHETINPVHYGRMHPPGMTLERRLECLTELREIGFKTGSGFMVGSPYQTLRDLAKELRFFQEFRPDMCGIGPYLVHKDTPFHDQSNGDVDMTLFLISMLRLIKPDILLPATTALGTARKSGREAGILAGANVLMPNMTPGVRGRDYNLYDNKLYTGLESGENIKEIKDEMMGIGYETVISPGDDPKSPTEPLEF
jgi:biotin synthase